MKDIFSTNLCWRSGYYEKIRAEFGEDRMTLKELYKTSDYKERIGNNHV